MCHFSDNIHNFHFELSRKYLNIWKSPVKKRLIHVVKFLHKEPSKSALCVTKTIRKVIPKIQEKCFSALSLKFKRKPTKR